jgi:hypothetical protein
VLTRPEPLERLLAALEDCDRLVLLGDTVELVESASAPAFEVAVPVLRAIGARLGAEGEVVVVPGNHDAALIRPWVMANGERLVPATPIPRDATPALVKLVAALAPAQVRVSYPGVWLGDGVWATHGHYLDQYLFPVGASGIARAALRGKRPQAAVTPLQYELARRPAPGWLMRSLPDRAARRLADIADVFRASTMPKIHRHVLNPRLSPLISTLLGRQMQRHAIPALLAVVEGLGVEADWILFGHVHRLGPLPGDLDAEWRGREGTPRILNSGSWLYEPVLVDRATPPHPYWPGGAIRLSSGEAPTAVCLLEDVPASSF